MTGNSPRFRVAWAIALAGLGACGGSLPPLRGRIEVGRDAYAIYVAGAAPAGGDLYAIRADGGEALPITFTNVGEMRPRLSPDGGSVVFLRGQSLTDSTPATIWVMNLLSGAERELRLPKGAARPVQPAWADEGHSIVVSTGREVYRFAAPPAPDQPVRVPPKERPAADSALGVVLGRPPFALVVPCPAPGALCLATDSGTATLAEDAHDPLPWGGDSVAYFVGDAIEIRPLGAGRSRRMDLNGPPRPRQMTAFTGATPP